MLDLIKRNLQGKKVFWLFVITQIVYFTMILITIPKLNSAEKNITIFDVRPAGYNYPEAIQLLTDLGEKGRNTYLWQQIPLDLIYPGLFAISNCLILAYFLNKLNLLNSKFIYLTFIPVLSGLFDYLENFCIITMLKSFPDISENLVQLASFFTVSKSALTVIYFTTLLIILLSVGYSRFIHKNNK